MSKISFIKVIFISIVLTSFFGCSPEDGIDGTNGSNGIDGSNGTDGTDGLNSLIRTLIEQPGANCSNGGYIVEVGLDNNNNEQLDSNEVTASEYICNTEDLTATYTSYVSLINQTGTNNPESVVLENTLDISISWVRESQGKYVGTLSNSINIAKTVVFYTTPTSHTGVRGELIGDNQVRMELQNGINVFQDNFTNLSFELRQYD